MDGRVALQTGGSGYLPVWLFIQNQGSFLSLTTALDRNSTQGVPADILEPERLGLEEGGQRLASSQVPARMTAKRGSLKKLAKFSLPPPAILQTPESPNLVQQRLFAFVRVRV